jgi:hypothetical protein
VKLRGASYTACAARLDWAQVLCEAIAEQGYDIALRLVRDKTVRTLGGGELRLDLPAEVASR